MGTTKKTIVSASDLADNYGLFANEIIKKNQFICEYKGELITREESDRRSIFNEFLGNLYFFSLNENFDIDGLLQGNEMRYFFFIFFFNFFILDMLIIRLMGVIIVLLIQGFVGGNIKLRYLRIGR